MIDLTPVFNAIIALATALATAFLIPWIRSRMTSEQREELLAWVDIAVAAAEQLFIGSGRGDEKKEYVLRFLATHGYQAHLDSIDTMIEAAVKHLKEKVKG